MKKVRFYISDINKKEEDIFEYSDNVTDEQINSEFEVWRDSFIDTGWHFIDDEE